MSALDQDQRQPNEKQLFTRVCAGGPLDGVVKTSRFPKGFVYGDKQFKSPSGVKGRVWVYDADEENGKMVFTAREVDQLDWDKLEKAWTESNYDVLAYDDGEFPDDLEVGL